MESVKQRWIRYKMKPHETHPLSPDQQGLFSALIGDGRPLLIFAGLSIVLSGGFALFLAATGHFLPHDSQFLGIPEWVQKCQSH